MCQCDYRHVIRLEYEIFPINFEMNIHRKGKKSTACMANEWKRTKQIARLSFVARENKKKCKNEYTRKITENLFWYALQRNMRISEPTSFYAVIPFKLRTKYIRKIVSIHDFSCGWFLVKYFFFLFKNGSKIYITGTGPSPRFFAYSLSLSLRMFCCLLLPSILFQRNAKWI